MRGFTEALRRELADTSVRVHYVAPRATRTGINTSAVERMNEELGVAMDPPELVAKAVCDMLAGGRAEAVLGWPEKFFARVNGVLPRLVDGALRKQLPVIRRYADRVRGTVHEPDSWSTPMKMHRYLFSLRRAAGHDWASWRSAPDPAFDAELLSIQQAWAKANYETPAGDARKEAFDALEKRAEAFTKQHPGRAEALIWEGIIESSYAGAKGGLRRARARQGGARRTSRPL